jgi:hypothetical protein
MSHDRSLIANGQPRARDNNRKKTSPQTLSNIGHVCRTRCYSQVEHVWIIPALVVQPNIQADLPEYYRQTRKSFLTVDLACSLQDQCGPLGMGSRGVDDICTPPKKGTPGAMLKLLAHRVSPMRMANPFSSPSKLF